MFYGLDGPGQTTARTTKNSEAKNENFMYEVIRHRFFLQTAPTFPMLLIMSRSSNRKIFPNKHMLFSLVLHFTQKKGFNRKKVSQNKRRRATHTPRYYVVHTWYIQYTDDPKFLILTTKQTGTNQKTASTVFLSRKSPWPIKTFSVENVMLWSWKASFSVKQGFFGQSKSSF